MFLVGYIALWVIALMLKVLFPRTMPGSLSGWIVLPPLIAIVLIVALLIIWFGGFLALSFLLGAVAK